MNRVLLIAVDYPPHYTGGIARYYGDIASFAHGRVAVVTGRCRGAAEYDAKQPCRCVRVPLPAFTSPVSKALAVVALTLGALRELIRESCRVVIAGHWFLVPGVLAVSKLVSARSAVILHGGELSKVAASRWASMALCWVLNRLDIIIVNSRYTRRQCLDYGIVPHKLRVITPAIDINRVLKLANEASATPPTDGSGEVIRLLTVGTLVRREGP